MGVFAPIPLQAGFTSMGELADLMLKKRALQQEAPLKEAKANEANMMAQLYSTALGLPPQQIQQQKPEPSILDKIMGMFQSNGQEQQPQAPANQGMGQGSPQGMDYVPQDQLSPEGQQNASAARQQNGSYVLRPEDINANKMNRKDLVNAANKGTDFFQRSQGAPAQPNAQQTSGNGLPNTPEAKKARQILQALGKWEETPEEKEARETRTAASTEWTKSDVKQVEGWNKTIDANRAIEPNLQIIEDKLATPEAKQLFSHPEFFGWDLAYAKKFGDPQAVDIITTMNTAGKDLFTTVGAQFKGPFRKFEFNLLNEAFPTQNDTFAQKYSKLMALKAMKGVATDALSTASELVRESNGAISPNKALEMAMKKNNVEDRMKQVKREFDEKMKDATFKKKEYERNHKEGNPQPPPMFASRDEFVKWFNRQPEHIKKAYRKEVAEGGS